MRKTLLFVAGIAVGVYLVKQIESNPEAKKAVQEAGKKVKTFANAVAAGYKEQEIANTKARTKKSK